MEDRADYAVHRKVAYEKINAMVKSHGINVLGDQDKLLLGLMQTFAIEIGNILGEPPVVQPAPSIYCLPGLNTLDFTINQGAS